MVPRWLPMPAPGPDRVSVADQGVEKSLDTARTSASATSFMGPPVRSYRTNSGAAGGGHGCAEGAGIDPTQPLVEALLGGA